MLHNMLRAAAGNRGGIPTDGLIAWYTMDNISGSTLVDEMGNYDGTIGGAIDRGGHLEFDGIDDYVSIPNFIDLGNAGSIVIKVKLVGTQNSIICGHPSTGVNDRLQIGIFNGKLNGSITSKNYQDTTLATGVGVFGNTYTIIMYWDAGDVWIDTDGTNRVTSTYSGTVDTNNSSWFLGANGPGSLSAEVNIYEFIVYDKPLNESDRSAIYDEV